MSMIIKVHFAALKEKVARKVVLRNSIIITSL